VAGAGESEAAASAVTSVRERFPIVGIGASAGWLEAFEQFFRAMPTDNGMGFMLVQHLDPSHASILTEILQRSTGMPVVEAQDRPAVEPNRVHVIPPNRDMDVVHGMLCLSVPNEPRGQRTPIDAFLRSLAEDQGEHAVGVTLSGTGTDGTVGLRAVFGAGGLCLVQAPASAKFNGMPESAIRAGYATRVLTPDQMPHALRDGTRPLPIRQAATLPSPAAGGLARILMLLRSATGHDFSQYKKSTLSRRIARRMALHGNDDAEVYARAGRRAGAAHRADRHQRAQAGRAVPAYLCRGRCGQRGRQPAPGPAAARGPGATPVRAEARARRPARVGGPGGAPCAPRRDAG
jgi:two-component system CheB/CheR fusion protein